jgi:signal transduction histidine kinase
MQKDSALSTPVESDTTLRPQRPLRWKDRPEGAIQREQPSGTAPVDDATHSMLGRRLLELVRAEIVRAWPATPDAQAQLLPLLASIERVREALESQWEQDFGSRLSGSDGLELLIGVVHDLRSPLTSILFLAETLQRGQSGDVNEVQRRQLGLIYGAALGLSAIASDVIELARGGDSLMEQQPAPFSITEIFESVCDIVRPIAEEKHLLVYHRPPVTDYRVGHPLALSRVLLNLTTNALKFTDTGFVEIVARETTPSGVEFSVRDSGRGIAPELLDHLYQPFRRVSGGCGYSISKAGIGLTMCQKLVRAMGSELHVETSPESGTKFFFELRLPAASAP